MTPSRVITLALLLSSFLFLVYGLISSLTENMLKTILGDEFLRIETPQEKLECRDIRLTMVNSYVINVSVKIVNMGKIGYSTKDFEHFDLFLIFVYDNAAESGNLMREFFRVPYKSGCNIKIAPCWHVTKISSIAKPNGSEVQEMINPSDYASAQWIWDSNEIAYVDIYIPANVSPAGVFVTLVTPSGQVAKPMNFINM
jgi:hypothetical protein